MFPLTCVNCCYNPLQIGPLGTAFGFCTRHREVLTHPEATTCGQLLRKDLLAVGAGREQAIHAKTYTRERVVSVAYPSKSAEALNLAEKANGQLPPDPVVDEVQGYGLLDSKIATMAALRRLPGSRAEVAMLSLSRGYFRNCVRRGGKWTAGVHLLFWVLGRLDAEPTIEATDLRGPIGFSLEKTTAVAKWMVISFRLAFVADVGARAKSARDQVGSLAGLAQRAVMSGPPDRPERVLSFLRRTKKDWRAPLSPSRYSDLRDALHVETEEEDESEDE